MSTPPTCNNTEPTPGTSPRGIDVTFPVARVKNDSQGFRDNFCAIDEHIAALETFKDDVAASTAKTNNFNGNRLENASLKEVRGTFNAVPVNINEGVDILFSDGNYQLVDLDRLDGAPNERVINLIGFPNDNETITIPQDDFIAKTTLEFWSRDSFQTKNVMFKMNPASSGAGGPIIDKIYTNTNVLSDSSLFWIREPNGDVSFNIETALSPVIIEVWIYKKVDHISNELINVLFLNYIGTFDDGDS